ncbi:MULTISPECIES: universal stress protein [unclassified Streptomyces]|uniref:universal stress protein n=1 Tax=unclassified Streptomyces TaxID=2593676 RepID=UPI0033343DA5
MSTAHLRIRHSRCPTGRRGTFGPFPGLLDHRSPTVRKAQEAEVLVLGSRGLGAMTGFLVGPVSRAVLAHAECPVVVVRPATWLDADCPPVSGSDRARREVDRSVVLGLDLSHPSAELLDHAFDAAAVRRAPLRVIHRWSMPPAFAFDPAPLAPELRDGMATSTATALADELRPWRDQYPEVRVEVDCSVGQPADQLVEASADASLVVVGRRIRRSAIGTHLGPVVHAVLHHATAPVAVAPRA